MRYKIVRVLNGVVSVGSSDGTFFNVPASDLDFKPQNGMAVQCFKNGDNVIVFMDGVQPPSLTPRINQPVMPKNVNAPYAPINQVQTRQSTAPIENVLGEEKKSHALLISLLILAVAIAVFVGVYFYSGNNTADLAKEYQKAVACYLETKSPSCKKKGNAILQKYDNMLFEDKALFKKYITDHGYMSGPYEDLFQNGL